VSLPSRTRAALRLGTIGALAAALSPAQAYLVRHRPRRADALARWFHRRAADILRVELRRRGTPSARRPTLFVSNHVSYLDITLISALVETGFVAKGDIAGWPVIGGLARLQRTLFVARRRGAVAEQVEALRARLAAGDNLVLFPEGTSTDGRALRPFKPALFGALDGLAAEVLVQPLWIAYRALDGAPLDAASRDRIAWYGDMTLLPHLATLAGHAHIAVEVGFGEPVRAAAFADRKALAAHCESRVARGLAEALAERPWWRRAAPGGAADLNPEGAGVIVLK